MKHHALLVILTVFSNLLIGQTEQKFRISDSENLPISSVKISIEGSDFQYFTDSKGEVVIPVSKPSKWVVSYQIYGFETKIDTLQVPNQNTHLVRLKDDAVKLNSIDVMALRASSKAPLAKTELSKKDIEEMNSGKDIPYILDNTPSIVTMSDAGTGIGYTGMRIRGSDGTRINVTVNGIPINDPESHGTFWVNMPDLASSTSSIQIQRGVGTSTNGAGAFGASVNIATETVRPDAFGIVKTGYGSFNSLRRSVQLGSGLIDGHWSFEGRLSQITSDGFIDRASSNLKSYYLAGGYYSENTVLKAIHFGGHERTYQAWYGIPQAKLNGDQQGIENYINNNGLDSADAWNIRNSGNRTYNPYTYANEVDDYGQDHYQLHWSQKWTPKFRSNISLHYTKGAGYYEQYKKQQDFSDYGLNNVIIGSDTISSTDLIRRRWLDNDFYGVVFSGIYDLEHGSITLGGAANRYKGLHYGELIWMQYASNSAYENHYYDGSSLKNDVNFYLKVDQTFGKLTGFVDLQARSVNYQTSGVDNDQVHYNVDTVYNFFNPKAGLVYNLSNESNVYASVAVANREPVRNDFIDAPAGTQPKSERLIDYEVGYRMRNSKIMVELNGFYMDYRDQLVLTGALNDVGASIRVNVPKSYRAGLEAQFGYAPFSWFRWNINMTVSVNKINQFTEILYDYSNGYDVVEITHENKDISYSPGLIVGNQFTFYPMNDLAITLRTKAVGQQYMDNTSNADRALAPYTSSDLQVTYTWKREGIEGIDFSLLGTNILNTMYSPNGYTFSYIYGSMITENFYFPMAGFNLMGNITLRF